MKTRRRKNPAAVALGRSGWEGFGGLARSAAKTRAARANGKRRTAEEAEKIMT